MFFFNFLAHIIVFNSVAVSLVVMMMMGSGEVSIKGSLQVSTELTTELNYELWEGRPLL